MTSTPLPPPPSEFKAVAPFLQRANELAKADPVISFWSLYYSAKMALSLNVQGGDNTFLFALMDKLEALKATLRDNDAATTDEAGSAYIENFALKVFRGADVEDRSGKADMNTAKKFFAASNFLELLSLFGPLNDDIKEKQTYAKWKAAEIAKAIKEGRKHAPGPPGWDPEEEKRQQAAEAAAEREAAQAIQEAEDDDDLLAREIARLTAPSRHPAAEDTTGEASGRRSTGATSSEDEAPFGLAISPSPDLQTSSQRRAPARLSFDAGRTLSDDPSTPDKPVASPPSSNPSSSPNFSHPLRPQFQRGVTGGSSQGDDGNTNGLAAPPHPIVSPGQGSPSITATPGEVTVPGRPLPLTPQQLQERAQDPFANVIPPTSSHQQNQHQQQHPVAPPFASPAQERQQIPSAPPIPFASAPTPAIPSAPTMIMETLPSKPTFPEVLSPQLTSKAQKLAKFAISALDYDDLDTARRQLREALDIVEGRTTVMK